MQYNLYVFTSSLLTVIWNDKFIGLMCFRDLCCCGRTLDWHTDQGINPEPEPIVPIGSAINKTDKPDGKKQGTVWAAGIGVILCIYKLSFQLF